MLQDVINPGRVFGVSSLSMRRARKSEDVLSLACGLRSHGEDETYPKC